MRWLAVLTMALAAAAHAEAVGLSVTPTATAGRGLPSIRVDIHEPIAGFRLTLTRSDGAVTTFQGRGAPGQHRIFELRQPEGSYRYSGELLVTFKDATSATMPVQFDAAFWGPLAMKIDPHDVDVAQRRLTLRLNRPCQRLRLQVRMDTGRAAFDGDVDCASLLPGQPFEVRWPEADGRTIKIAVKAFDAHGTYFGPVEFYPWSVEVPHEEVHFETARWEIPADEAPKLDRAYRWMDDAVSRVAPFAPIQLFVAGHTDSVGATEANLTLSLNRAKALASWFRGHGLHVPIWYAGVGESALAVPTPDETDEARNRRAQYILAIEPPPITQAPRAPAWKRL